MPSLNVGEAVNRQGTVVQLRNSTLDLYDLSEYSTRELREARRQLMDVASDSTMTAPMLLALTMLNAELDERGRVYESNEG